MSQGSMKGLHEYFLAYQYFMLLENRLRDVPTKNADDTGNMFSFDGVINKAKHSTIENIGASEETRVRAMTRDM